MCGSRTDVMMINTMRFTIYIMNSSKKVAHSDDLRVEILRRAAPFSPTNSRVYVRATRAQDVAAAAATSAAAHTCPHAPATKALLMTELSACSSGPEKILIKPITLV